MNIKKKLECYFLFIKGKEMFKYFLLCWILSACFTLFLVCMFGSIVLEEEEKEKYERKQKAESVKNAELR